MCDLCNWVSYAASHLQLLNEMKPLIVTATRVGQGVHFSHVHELVGGNQRSVNKQSSIRKLSGFNNVVRVNDHILDIDVFDL